MATGTTDTDVSAVKAGRVYEVITAEILRI